MDTLNEIKLASKEFYAALQAIFKGDASPMKDVWSHANDVTYLGPQGGILKGWDQVYNAWQQQAALKLQGNIDLQEQHVIQEGNIGVVQAYEVGTNLVHGASKKVKIRTTNIFRKESGKWKMITHQTDLLSFLD